MAEDIFVKLILPSRSKREINENGINYTSQFISSDADSFLVELKVDNPFSDIKRILGNIDTNTLEEDEIYKKYLPQRNKNNFYKRVLDRQHIYYKVIDALAASAFESSIFKTPEGEALKQFFLKDNRKNLVELEK
ncbi:UNVERIFIED_CONTAM: hypothetical protein O8I53_08030 [Campylobacter lari]